MRIACRYVITMLHTEALGLFLGAVVLGRSTGSNRITVGQSPPPTHLIGYIRPSRSRASHAVRGTDTNKSDNPI